MTSDYYDWVAVHRNIMRRQQIFEDENQNEELFRSDVETEKLLEQLLGGRDQTTKIKYFVRDYESLSHEKREKNESCPICLEKFQKVVVETECGHIFCSSCIEKWVKETVEEHNTTCPLCRKVIAENIRYNYNNNNYYNYSGLAPL